MRRKRVVMVLACVFVLAGAATLGGGFVLWWPVAVSRVPRSALAPTATSSPVSDEVLREKLEAYSGRADNLRTLISVLLGLSTVFAIALGLSAYATIQSNLHEAERSTEKLESLLKEEEKFREKSQAMLHKELEEVRLTVTYARRITLASASLGLALQKRYLGDADQATRALVGLRETHPIDPTVNGYLGRLYKALKRYQSAAEAMSSFIQRKEQAGQGDDLITAAALYNRACYCSLCWGGATEDERTELRPRIEADLKRAFALNQQNKKEAGDDKDFASVRKLDWFARLLGAN